MSDEEPPVSPGPEQPPAGHDDRERLDGMERLWSPWRMAYVRDPRRVDLGCPFCRLPAQGPDHDAEALIVHRGPRTFVILNAYPYNPGHLMIVPYRHIAAFEELERDELHEIAELTQRAVQALNAASGPHAFNIGWNVGSLAGAGIAEHLHEHVVPRWGGDTNFMPVVGQTRVLPQLLADTYELLRPAFERAG